MNFYSRRSWLFINIELPPVVNLCLPSSEKLNFIRKYTNIFLKHLQQYVWFEFFFNIRDLVFLFYSSLSSSFIVCKFNVIVGESLIERTVIKSTVYSFEKNGAREKKIQALFRLNS